MATTIYGGTVKGYWRVYLSYNYYPNYSGTQAKIDWWYGISFVKAPKGTTDSNGNYQSEYDRPTYVSCTSQTTQNRYPTAKFTTTWWNNGGRSYQYGSGTFYFNKTTSAQSKTITAYSKHTTSSTTYTGASSTSYTFSVPALASYTVTYNGNGGSGVPANQTKWYGSNLTLSATTPTLDGYAFKNWRATNGTFYNAGGVYGANEATTMTAQWGAVDPPTCDVSGLSLTINGGTQTSADIIRGFTSVSVDYDVNYIHDGRNIAKVTLSIAGHEVFATTDSGTLTIPSSAFQSADEGTQTVYLYTEDNEGAVGIYELGTINIVAPTWEEEVTISKPVPSKDSGGNAILDSLQIYNYTTDTFDTVSKDGIQFVDNGDDTWTFTYVFDENHVDDPTVISPDTQIVATYKHYDSDVKVGSQAFFSTTRNQNYSNGIYNVMFVGGVDNKLFPEYTSRTWWCKINDPLYFPDTNYIEVGSNDTAVQGLTKVGDYLAVVKQSKTTDTAIFLLYPTSFEEETTYAVKQGVQGVGALSRYSFNILGDETLFLSPKGVVAVVPTQDEEHKVQNRSYFVDKRLLAEDAKEAYSFVHDGKYFLAIGNGHVYVLDGNQRNSWGNDRTVLVYECYYLENVPAKCFVKYQDILVFSDDTNVCIFNDGYVDAYDGDEENVPVKAEWSTIFDDDGSLHYYKTMQKKGNLVSILPIENELPYTPVTVDEADFNADKTHYWILEDGKYIQCTDSDEYSAETQYYIENRSNTKVLVKKDDKEPVEIERKFGLNSNITSELFINKKFKKYKRLQFILRNDADEDFGVDEIVKNYTVGNYAKK